MKKTMLILGLLMFTSVWSKAQTQQGEYKNAVYVSGGAFMVLQKNQFKPIAEFRPSIQIQYNRILWKGLGISAGYAFKRANPNARTTDGGNVQSKPMQYIFRQTIVWISKDLILHRILLWVFVLPILLFLSKPIM